jgi:hypothetical protein
VRVAGGAIRGEVPGVGVLVGMPRGLTPSRRFAGRGIHGAHRARTRPDQPRAAPQTRRSRRRVRPRARNRRRSARPEARSRPGARAAQSGTSAPAAKPAAEVPPTPLAPRDGTTHGHRRAPWPSLIAHDPIMDARRTVALDNAAPTSITADRPIGRVPSPSNGGTLRPRTASSPRQRGLDLVRLCDRRATHASQCCLDHIPLHGHQLDRREAPVGTGPHEATVAHRIAGAA